MRTPLSINYIPLLYVSSEIGTFSRPPPPDVASLPSLAPVAVAASMILSSSSSSSSSSSYWPRVMFTRGASRKRRPAASAPVYLNVYDLTPINGYAYWLGLGVYHSGVQVHGVEYAYGAHEHPTTGIFEGEPRQCPGFAFRKAILIGRTDLGSREVRALMEEMSADYSGDTYNLISKNCNHFCDDACLRLAGNHIPKWVNRLAKIGFLCKCVLPVRVAAVRKRGAEEAKRGVDADMRRLRSNSARFPPEGATTPPSNISKPEVTISSRCTGGRRLRRSASLSSSSSSLC